MVTLLSGNASRAALGLQTLGTKVLLIIGSSTAAGGGYESPDKPLYGGSGVGGSNSSGAGWINDDLTAAGWTVINVGVGSTDTAYWLAALPGHLALYRPDIVIVACSSAATGDNVVASEANYNSYVARHTEMFRLIRQTGAVPVCQPQLPNNNSYSNVMLERMRRFGRWLETTGVLSWDILSVLGSEAMDGQFWNVTATCGINGTVNFTTTSLQPKVGQYVTGTGIAANTRVATFTPGVGGTLTIAATATNASASLNFAITLDGTHLFSKAGAHTAAYKALPLDLITQNRGQRPTLPDYHGMDRHGIQYTGTDGSAPITIPITGIDSFSLSFDLKNTDTYLSIIALTILGPDSSRIRFRGANGSWSLRFESNNQGIQSTLADLDVTDGIWHRWTITYHAISNKWRLYRDGIQVTTAASPGNALEADGSVIYVPNTPVTGIVLGNGVNGGVTDYSAFYLRGSHCFRNLVLHEVPLAAGDVLSMANGIMKADSLSAWFPCDDAVRNSSGQLPLGGQLRNVAGTLATATLSATGAFLPSSVVAAREFNPAIPGAIGGTTPGSGAFTNVSASGAYTVQNGTVTAPSISFSGASSSGFSWNTGLTGINIGVSNNAGVCVRNNTVTLYIPIGFGSDNAVDIGGASSRARAVYAYDFIAERTVRLKSFTVATVPAASLAAGSMIYVSNESTGANIAISDGTNWRTPNRTIIS